MESGIKTPINQMYVSVTPLDILQLIKNQYKRL